jgi:hypothetical protein
MMREGASCLRRHFGSVGPLLLLLLPRLSPSCGGPVVCEEGGVGSDGACFFDAVVH